MNNDLDRLVDAVGTARDAWASRLETTASQRRARFIAAARRPAPRASYRWWFLAGGALAAAALVLVILVSGAGAIEFTVDGSAASSGHSIVAAGAPVDVSFSDGTRLEAEPGSQLRVDVQRHGATIRLDAGSVRMAVRKRPAANWAVLAGPYTVRVVGTRFTTSWSGQPRRLEVTVDEGSVAVSGPRLDDTVVAAGHELAVGAASPEPGTGSQTADRAEPAPAEDPSPEILVPSVEPHPQRRATARRREANGWAKLAARGDYDQAFAAASVGGFERRCRSASVSQLEELADVARYAAKTKAARGALQILRKRFPGTVAAKRSAYRLGRLEFEQSHRYREAARWFKSYLDESPRGSLAQSALGRLVESYDRSGQDAKAKHAARRYLERFPRGPHADIARSLR